MPWQRHPSGGQRMPALPPRHAPPPPLPPRRRSALVHRGRGREAVHPERVPDRLGPLADRRAGAAARLPRPGASGPPGAPWEWPWRTRPRWCSFIIANKLTTAANAIFLQDTAPLYVLLLSPLLLREKPSRSELMAAPIFLLGLSLFFLDQLQPGQLLGNVHRAGLGRGLRAQILGLRAASRRARGALWGNLLAGAERARARAGRPRAHGAGCGLLVFLGVFQLGLAYALFHRGHPPHARGGGLAAHPAGAGAQPGVDLPPRRRAAGPGRWWAAASSCSPRRGARCWAHGARGSPRGPRRRAVGRAAEPAPAPARSA